MAAHAFRDRARCESILMTRGDQGMWLLTREVEGQLPASAREVADVTGAGDTVIATMALAMAAGATLVEAAQLSNAAAGVAVSKFGAATVAPAELLRALELQPTGTEPQCICVQTALDPIVIGLDILAVGLAVLAAAIARAGGFVFLAGGVRVSLSTPQRTLAWLCVVIVIRLIAGRRIGPFGRATARVASRCSTRSATIRFSSPRRPGAGDAPRSPQLGIAAALAIVLQNQLLHMYSVPDLGDPLFSIWRICVGRPPDRREPVAPLRRQHLYPERLTLTLSDPVILPALTIAPLLAVGVHPVVAYNLLFLSGFWLSGVATYLLVERLTQLAARGIRRGPDVRVLRVPGSNTTVISSCR